MRRLAFALFAAVVVVAAACSSDPEQQFPPGLPGPPIGGQAAPPGSGTGDGGVPGSDDGGTGDGGMTDGGTGDGGIGDGGTGDGGAGIDTSEDGIRQFLQGDGFRGWPNESTAHAIDISHGSTLGRVFVSPSLAQSMNANATVHPNSSVAVLEVYTGDGAAVFGHSVMAKDDSGRWVFFQGQADEYLNPQRFEGTNNFCGQCHGAAGGNDFIRTTATGIDSP